MGINLAEIQQKQDRLLANIAEQNRKAYKMFYSPTPANVTLPQYDENGNLLNVTIPNRARIKEQIWNDAATGMYKIYYVDAVNGNDGNDGTSTSPFATLRKAIIAVPRGGLGIIYVKGDLVQTSEQRIGVEGRKIIIRAHADTPNAVLTFRNTNGKDALDVNYNSHLSINMDCAFENVYDTNLRSALSCYGNSQIAILNNYQATVQNGTSIKSNVTVGDNTRLVWIRNAGLYYANMNITTGTNCLLFGCGETGAVAGVNKGTITLNGATPTDTDIINLTAGIIKDANGVPRNIVSNVIF